MGPIKNVSLSEIPFDDLADASKTTLTLVVVLCSLRTACLGR